MSEESHSCQRSSPDHGNIFAANSCMGCAIWAAAGSPNNGWTEPKLASTMAEYRMHGQITDGVKPEAQDIERSRRAFELAREAASS